MKTDPVHSILWTIHFDSEVSGSNWKDKAQFTSYFKPPMLSLTPSFALHNPAPEPSIVDPLQMIPLLEKMQVAFREIMRAYLLEFEKNPQTSEQVQELQAKFKDLDKWLEFIKQLFNTHPDKSS